MAKFTKVGTILTKKSGKGVYIKVDNDVSLKKGEMLAVVDPRNRKGITEEQLVKIPSFVEAEILLVTES